MVSIVDFLAYYDEKGELLLNRYATIDETWIRYVNLETKQQSMMWVRETTSHKPKKVKKDFSARKFITTVFW